MAKSKKKNTKTALFLYHLDGTKFAITGEDGKYWYCGDTQFFKSGKYKVTYEEISMPADRDAE